MASYKINVEISILIAVFASMLTVSVSTNLVIYRTCYIVMGYNKTVCALLGTKNTNQTEDLEKLVEPKAAVINMVRHTIEACVGLLLCLFIGPWSDRFGRKPILVINLLGSAMSFVLMTLFCFWDNLSPWYLLVTSIPSMLTGGTAAFMTVALAYITDTTSDEHRGLRMGMLDALVALGFLLGNTSSSFLFNATSYVCIYAVSAGFHCLAALYTVFFIPESLRNRETENKINGFFQISNVRDMLKVTLIRREHFNRAIIGICIFIAVIFNIAFDGQTSLNFMYMREKFLWSLEKYTLFTSAASLLCMTGTVLGVYVLHVLFKLTESIIVLVGFTSTCSAALLTGFATKDWHIYLAAVIGILGVVISPMLRSLMSKLVGGDEIGKLFSVMTVFVSLFGLSASPLYTAIYNSTIDTDAGIFYFVTAGFHIICMISICIVISLQNFNSQHYSQLHNVNEPATEGATNISANSNGVTS